MPTDTKPARKSVVDGVIQRLSVSQVEGFDPRTPFGCMRRWWFKYVAGIPEPQSAATQVGTNLHGEIERFLKTGDNGLGRIALSGKQYIDDVLHEPVRLIEHHFDGELAAEKIPFVGYIDVVMPTRPEILDWKTTSDIDAWAKNAAQLPKTTQMAGYAKWFFGQHPNFDSITLTHVYFQTRGSPRSESRSCAVLSSDIDRTWSDIEQMVRSMRDVAKTPQASQVEGVHDSKCFRCSYKAICPPPDEKKVDLMSLLHIFDDAPAPALSAAAAPVAPDTAPATDGKMEGQPAPVKDESQKSDGPVEKFTESTAKTLGLEEPPLEVPAPGEGKKRRGRPPGSGKKVAVGEETAAPASDGPLTLLINCIPAGSLDATMGDRYVRDLCAKLEEKFGVHDIRVPPADPAKAEAYAAALGFGKWKGALSALVRANLPASPRTVVFATHDEVASVVVEALRPLADVIITGVR